MGTRRGKEKRSGGMRRDRIGTEFLRNRGEAIKKRVIPTKSEKKGFVGSSGIKISR